MRGAYFDNSGARFIEGTTHDFENFRARFFGAQNRLGYDFVADAGELQIELVTGDAVHPCRTSLKSMSPK